MRYVMPLVLVITVLLSTFWLGHTVADRKHAVATAAAERAAAARYTAEQREGTKAVADLTQKFNALADQYRALETTAHDLRNRIPLVARRPAVPVTAWRGWTG